jgi:hypothetical protein
MSQLSDYLSGSLLHTFFLSFLVQDLNQNSKETETNIYENNEFHTK